MGEVKKIEVDIRKVAEQMGLNSERMLEYVFQRQPQPLSEPIMQDCDTQPLVSPEANVLFHEPIIIPEQGPLNSVT